MTRNREEVERSLEALEEAEDIATLQAVEAREARIGTAAAQADYLPIDQVVRLLAGDPPLAIWREQRGLSRAALADRAGVSRRTVARIERRQSAGSLASLQALARALSVGLDALLPAGPKECDPEERGPEGPM